MNKLNDKIKEDNNQKNYSAVIKIPKTIDYKKIIGNLHEYKRSVIEIAEDNNNFIFNINSNDMTALRASLNLLFRELHVIEDVSKI